MPPKYTGVAIDDPEKATAPSTSGQGNQKKITSSGWAHFGIIPWFTGRFLNNLITECSQAGLKMTKDKLLREPAFTTSECCAKFDVAWTAEIERAKALPPIKQKVKGVVEDVQPSPSVIRALWKAFLGDIITSMLYKFLWGTLLVVVVAYFVRQLLAVVEERFAGKYVQDEGLGLVFGFFAATLLLSACLQQMTIISARIGVRCRIALTIALYRKSMVVDAIQVRPQQVVQLISTDSLKLAEAAVSAHYLWSGLVEAIALVITLFVFTGEAALPGFGVLLILLPLQYALGLGISIARKKVVVASHLRTMLMEEVISSIKLVKMYAWEDQFAGSVELLRKEETRLARHSGWVKACSVAAVFALPPLMGLGVFSVRELMGTKLDAGLAFTTLSLFNTLRLPLVQLPKGIRSAAEAIAACQRIRDFLIAPERQPKPLSKDVAEGVRLELTDVSLSYMQTGPAQLKNITLIAKRGQLVAITGPVGSGKSMILFGILDQIRVLTGSVKVAGSMAFVSQTPWCVQGTVRHNIIFGQPFDELKYRRVLHDCALDTDITQLAKGDQTQLGERGANVSGGQKQRISLARAAYAGADIMLLDSPLSAVDAYTGHHIFTHCIQRLRASGTTIVMTTHNDELLSNADVIVLMGAEGIHYIGPYDGKMIEARKPVDMDHHLDQILSEARSEFEEESVSQVRDPNGMNLSQVRDPNDMDGMNLDTEARATNLRNDILLLKGLEDDAAEEQEGSLQLIRLHSSEHQVVQVEEPRKLDKQPRSPSQSHGKRRLSIPGIPATQVEEHPHETAVQLVRLTMAASYNPGLRLAPDETIEHERVEVEVVKISTANGYMSFFSAMGFALAVVVFLLFAFTQVCRIFSDIWVSTWVAHKGDRDKSYYVEIYGGYVGLFIFLLILRGQAGFSSGLLAASRLHNAAFSAVLKAQFAWFSVTPLGGILSVFSSDMDVMDDVLQDTMAMVCVYFMILVTTNFIVIRAVYEFAGILGGVLLLAIYWFHVYLSAAVSIKKLVVDSNAVVSARASEAVGGMAVIQAYRKENFFLSEFTTSADHALVAACNLDLLQMWLSIRMDLVGCLLVLGTTLLCVLVEKPLPTGSAGLAISNSFQILLFLSLMSRGMADVHACMSSVENISKLTLAPAEIDLPHTEDTVAPPSWPVNGMVEFVNVIMSYAPNTPKVLKGVSFVIGGGQKIGVVGRTGAGKSSLIMALFRLSECVEGLIMVDGVDVSKLTRKEMRCHIAIIPQEPVMFRGTLRSNLDPFNQHTDEVLTTALERCLLSNLLDHSLGLDQPVTHMGKNFSLGMQQLICLARALLNKSKLLLLDEATAALDSKTDAQVQTVLRTRFADRTTITIAHRLETIIDSDKVLVMDGGRVAEFDSPFSLLSNNRSIFFQLCAQTGESAKLLSLAAKRHKTSMDSLLEVASDHDKRALGRRQH